MIEAGVVVHKNGQPLYWHVPDGRSTVSLPDSNALWKIFWQYRDEIAGFAHTHPGKELPEPSNEDITTFSAVELALGRRLMWWISSISGTVLITWRGPDKYDYAVEPTVAGEAWIQHLSWLSHWFD